MPKKILHEKGNEKFFDGELLTLLKENKNDKVLRALKEYQTREASLTISRLRDNSQATLLHYAAIYGNEEIVRHLIDSDIEIIDAQDVLGRTALEFAMRKKHEALVEVLLKAKARLVDISQRKSALHKILKLKSTHSTMIRRLFKGMPLQRIIEVDLVKSLRDYDFTLSEIAAIGNVELLKLSLEQGYFHVNDRDTESGKTALHFAVKTRNVEMVRVLVEHDADHDAVDHFNQTPLWFLYSDHTNNVSGECLEILKILIRRATMLTTCNHLGLMQVYNVAVYGCRESVELVLQLIHNLDSSDEKGNTVAHYLIYNHDARAIGSLRGRKFDANACNFHGDTPLYLAAEMHLTHVVELLLESGADVHVRGSSNVKPLVALIRTLNINLDDARRCIQLFLEYGSDALDPDLVGSYKLVSRYHDKLMRSHRREKAKSVLAMMEPLIAQIAVSKAREVEVNEITLSYNVKLQPSWVHYFGICERQLQRMKLTAVYGRLTLFEFLATSQRKFTAYVRNEELVYELEQVIEEFEVNSPYPDLLRRRLAKAIQIAELKEKAIPAICWLVNFEECVFYAVAESIVEYLSSGDMINLNLSYGV